MHSYMVYVKHNVNYPLVMDDKNGESYPVPEISYSGLKRSVMCGVRLDGLAILILREIRRHITSTPPYGTVFVAILPSTHKGPNACTYEGLEIDLLDIGHYRLSGLVSSHPPLAGLKELI